MENIFTKGIPLSIYFDWTNAEKAKGSESLREGREDLRESVKQPGAGKERQDNGSTRGPEIYKGT